MRGLWRRIRNTDDAHAEARARMVATQIAARGVLDSKVLRAMREVPRHAFVPASLRGQAHADAALPLDRGQTISQPYVVAFMAEALALEPHHRVLEIGTGSGYGAAVLGHIAAEVYTIERDAHLAATAAERLRTLCCDNVHVVHGDGTRGLPEQAPFDAIVVTAGGPQVPRALRAQLGPGGRMVIPVGERPDVQTLLRIRRTGATAAYEEESLIPVRFVPLVGEEGWGAELSAAAPASLPERIAAVAEPFSSIDDADLGRLRARIGQAQVVLLGEASHGTAEFYRMRARITRELILHEGFTAVTLEADWPDAARIDHYVRDFEHAPPEWKTFSRFPTWMWRNSEFRELVDWLRAHNATLPPAQRVSVHGLDLYSMYSSIGAVLDYLDQVDPDTAQVARARYGCLDPWQANESAYGHAALTGRHRTCEPDVLAMLAELLDRRWEYMRRDGERFIDALQNARVIANAERYYRAMYYGTADSWNLRDRHMFDTLQAVLAARGAGARAVVWAHNSHIGDASATGMAARGEYNIGQLCREELGDRSYHIGFGTHTGVVAAASAWGGPMERKRVRPSHEHSYERLCHDTGIPAFRLPLRAAPGQADQRLADLREALMEQRLERMIGVIYRPETEMASHYVNAALPQQFDEYIWFDETSAVSPLDTVTLQGVPDTYPFAL